MNKLLFAVILLVFTACTSTNNESNTEEWTQLFNNKDLSGWDIKITGVVEEIGSDVTKIKKGDRVVVPFLISCGQCFFCQQGYHASCEHSNPENYGPEGDLLKGKGGGAFGFTDMYGGYNGGQAEYVRVPNANTGPKIIPDGLEDEQVLFLTDIFPTGWSAVKWGRIKPGDTVVIFGSGPVAAASLELLAKDFTIEAVVTKPRPAHHKGDVPVIRVAQALDIPIHTVINKRTLDALIDEKPFESTVAVLIDFGIIVSQKAIDYFPLGIINSHFSLLPEWRGADPITFSILSGQNITGVSLMLLVEAMDEGPLLGYGVYDLSDEITTPQLTEALVQLSNELIRTIVPEYIKGSIVPQPQTDKIEYYWRGHLFHSLVPQGGRLAAGGRKP